MNSSHERTTPVSTIVDGLLAVTLLSLGGCEARPALGPAQAIPAIVEIVRQDASEGPNKFSGPVLVDLQSLRSAMRGLLPADLSDTDIMESFHGRAQSSTESTAVRCSSDGSCEVQGDALLVRFDSAVIDPQAMTILSTSIVTERQHRTLATCHRTIRFTLGKRGTDWRIAGHQLVSTC